MRAAPYTGVNFALGSCGPYTDSESARAFGVAHFGIETMSRMIALPR